MGDPDYWDQRHYLDLQVDGVYDGYMAANEGKPERVRLFPLFNHRQALSKWQIQYANYDGDVGDWNSLPHGAARSSKLPDPSAIDRLDHCSALIRLTRRGAEGVRCSGQARAAGGAVDVERAAHDVQAAQGLRPPAAVAAGRDSGAADGVQHVPRADQQRRRLLHGRRVDGGAGDDDRELQRGAESLRERVERDAVGAEPGREPSGAVGAVRGGDGEVAGGVVQAVRAVQQRVLQQPVDGAGLPALRAGRRTGARRALRAGADPRVREVFRGDGVRERGAVKGRLLNRKGYFASYNIAFDPFIYEMSGAEKLYEEYISDWE